MASFKSVTLTNLNKINGAATTVEVTLDLAFPILNGDIFHLEISDDLSFAEEVTCEIGNALVK
jgi:hypothetical protein